jgi:UDP-N-acetylmuramoylalanine-D-glutamate ligase
MALEPLSRRIGVVGIGVIGASWAAYFLAKGFDVAATDPADGAEKRLRTQSPPGRRRCSTADPGSRCEPKRSFDRRRPWTKGVRRC